MNRTRKTPCYYLNDIGELKPDVDNGSEREKQKAFFSLLSERKFIEKVKALII